MVTMGTSSNQPTSKQDYTSVDMEDAELPLAALIKKQLHDLDPISAASCIYRVPPTLRQVNDISYTPQIVSIGPFHHGKKGLVAWEERKLRYLQAFLHRTRKSLEDCIELVKDWEERARYCYREIIDLSSDAFVKMMLVDSCFIIVAMWRAQYTWQESTDYLSNPDRILIVKREMILLENQIPFFVLHGLYEFGFSELYEDRFIELSIQYFSDLLLTETEYGDAFENVKRHRESGFEIQHLTDLLRICHLPTDLQKDKGNFVSIPTAASLQEAGMKLEIGKSNPLLDMKYYPTGLLEIALEMCSYPLDSYIIDYVFFMKMFINTATDVDLLIQKGIIENHLNDSAAVASLFNILAPDTTLVSPSYYFTSISEEINAYCKVPWRKWKVIFLRDYWQMWKETLKRDYCSTPWKIASTAAAILLLVLTLIQTICSVISVH